MTHSSSRCMRHDLMRHEWDMTHSHRRRTPYIYVTRPIHMWHDSSLCAMTHFNSSFFCVVYETWHVSSCHIWMSHVTYTNEVIHRYEWVMSCMNESRHIYTYMNETCFVHHAWLIHTWHDSFISVTYLICICDVTHSYMTWRIPMCRNAVQLRHNAIQLLLFFRRRPCLFLALHMRNL